MLHVRILASARMQNIVFFTTSELSFVGTIVDHNRTGDGRYVLYLVRRSNLSTYYEIVPINLTPL
jgi:hypothetical protein